MFTIYQLVIRISLAHPQYKMIISTWRISPPNMGNFTSTPLGTPDLWRWGLNHHFDGDLPENWGFGSWGLEGGMRVSWPFNQLKTLGLS